MVIITSVLVLAGSIFSVAAWPGNSVIIEASAVIFAGALFTTICAVEARD